VDEVLEPLERWTKGKTALLEHFTPTRADELEEDLDTDLSAALGLLSALADQLGDTDEWEAYATARTALAESGLETVVAYCAEHRVDAALVTALVERALYAAWADDVLKVDAHRLTPLRAADRDALVEEFAALDQRRVATAAAEIIQACSIRRPTTTVGPAATIRREAEKKTRHMPIKRLLAETGVTAQRLKPCFMMSPLAVSQFLPPSLTFDVVIFDEASQVRPSDAVNCIYRGLQLVVAGDKNQLPPTNFFGRDSTSSTDDAYDDGQLDEFGSVLEQCKASGAIQSLPLQWHYRSVHESLITYSNYRFYNGKLLTFPGAIEEAPDLGIQLFKVDGVYRRGGGRDNPIEAQKVVERVLFHRSFHPDLSVGVVTFSDAQESAVEAELEVQSAKHPELAGLGEDDRLNGFFIKNLESVQGDERDIIIFSVGYGYDEAHKFSMNFGPLNRPGGWRRLNVAITRARRRVEVITSVLPGDFNAGNASEGVRHLKGYLDYAVRGTPALALDIGGGGDAESPFEEEVIRVVRGWGYDVQPQVGVAGYRVDIGVRHPSKPGSFSLGVECDGATYHSSKTARDRDRLRQSVLEGLGWRLHRIWGPSWYRDRPAQENRLRIAIEDATAGRPAKIAPLAPPEQRPQIVIDVVPAEKRPPWMVPYVEAVVERTGGNLQPSDLAARPQIRRLIQVVAKVEQPVHVDRITEAVGHAFGAERITKRLKDTINASIADLTRTGLVRDGDFLMHAGDVVDCARSPQIGVQPRTIRQVAPSEIQFALLSSVLDASHVERSELLVYVARLFGWGRLGTEIRNSLDDNLDRLIDNRQLVELDGRLSTPS
jgi:very-short-patch-repair endonuclease